MNRDSHILGEYDPPPAVSIPSTSSSLVHASMSSAVANAAPCLIPEKCLTSAKRNLSRDRIKINILSCGSTTTETGYFRCVCAKAQSLGNNEYFSAHCVFEECTDDGERAAFLKYYQDACKQLGNSLADIPDEWAPFATLLASVSLTLPPSTTSHDNVLTSAAPSRSTESTAISELTTSSTSTATTTAPSPTSPTISPAKHTSSAAIIAGGTISATVLLVLLLSLLKLYWNTKKKAKKPQVANAQLQDATNPDGVSQRISSLMDDEPAPPTASEHGVAAASTHGGKEMCDRGRGEDVTPGTVGFPYARYESVDQYSNQRDWSTSRCASYNAQQGFSDDMPADRRMSEYSESDYGSTRRRSWEELLASGTQEIRPLRVERREVG